MQGFEELTLIILVASIISIFIHYLRQPLVIGYIISGILVGHYFLNILTDPTSLELFSKLGIVILLFTIGLNLNPNSLKEAGKDASLGAILQVLVSSLFGYILSFYVLHFNVLTSVFVGVALAFSSTIIVLKILSDQGDTETLFGKISIGILLVQDILSAFILIILAMFNNNNYGVANAPQSAIIATFIVKVVVLLIIYFVLRKFVLKKSVSFFATSQEALLFFGLSSGFVMAYLFYKFGFSLEIGALFAGVALASSNFAKEISSRLKPIQDFFIAMFFVLLGANLVVENLHSLFIPIIIFVIFVIFIKLLLSFWILNIIGHRTRTSFYTAISLTQVSEFSLIMLALVASYGYIDKNIVSLVTIVAMISMAISAYMMIYVDDMYKYLRRILKSLEIKKNNIKMLDADVKDLDAVIFGFDRIGHKFVEVFLEMKFKYLVIDINPKYVQSAIESGVSAVYGDAEDLGFLQENNILNSNMIVSTIPNFKTNLFLVESYRKKNKNGVIVVIAQDESKSKELYNAGATYVIMPYHLGAYHASKMLLEFKKHPKIFEKEKKIQFDMMMK